eukprot:jgi/Chrzof1/1099/Cz01g40030.t1
MQASSRVQTSDTQDSNQVKARLSRALFDFNAKLASSKSGALVQIWMPEVCADGSVVLSAQGLPFAVAGVGDLLALFRCVSCRYRFSTDCMKPSLMGAIGRVYSSCEPEMSHNVQKYDKQVYLRVSEAQRCRVHSTLVMPVFDGDNRCKPLAVFELVQSDKDVVFPEVISWLRSCLEEVHMMTADPDISSVSIGLRKWPMEVDQMLMEPLRSNSAGRLLLENDVDDDDDTACHKPSHSYQSVQHSIHKLSLPSARAANTGTGHAGSGVNHVTGGTSPNNVGGGMGSNRNSEEGAGENDDAQSHPAQQLQHQQHQQHQQQFVQQGSLQHAGSNTQPAQQNTVTAAAVAAPPATSSPATQQQQEQQQPTSLPVPLQSAGGVSALPAPSPFSDPNLMAALAAAAVANNPSALQALQALQQQQQQQQQQPSASGQAAPQAPVVNIGSLLASSMQSLINQHAMQALKSLQDQLTAASQGSNAPNLNGLTVLTAGLSGPQRSLKRAVSTQALNVSRSGTQTHNNLGVKDEDEDEDLGDSDSDEGGKGREGNYEMRRHGSSRPLGAGRKLTYEDLQAQFGLGLKEAAANLGICATTLKRACRRNGITRWPRRQIAKLSRALNQMGYQGAPPATLVQSAMANNVQPSTLPVPLGSVQVQPQQQQQQYSSMSAPSLQPSLPIAIPPGLSTSTGMPGTMPGGSGPVGSGSINGGLLSASLGSGQHLAAGGGAQSSYPHLGGSAPFSNLLNGQLQGEQQPAGAFNQAFPNQFTRQGSGPTTSNSSGHPSPAGATATVAATANGYATAPEGPVSMPYSTPPMETSTSGGYTQEQQQQMQQQQHSYTQALASAPLHAPALSSQIDADIFDSLDPPSFTANLPVGTNLSFSGPSIPGAKPINSSNLSNFLADMDAASLEGFLDLLQDDFLTDGNLLHDVHMASLCEPGCAPASVGFGTVLGKTLVNGVAGMEGIEHEVVKAETSQPF